jgi:hypothetical protein
VFPELARARGAVHDRHDNRHQQGMQPGRTRAEASDLPASFGMLLNEVLRSGNRSIAESSLSTREYGDSVLSSAWADAA